MCNVFSLLRSSVKKFPNKVYVVDKGMQYSYTNIYNKTINIVEHIRNKVNAGDRILIYLDNSVEYIIAFFSILLANAIVVPINKNTSIENIKYVISNAEPKAIISSDALLKRINDIPELHGVYIYTINIESMTDNYPKRLSDFYGNLNLDSDTPAMILYTSGTTREPKGVTLTHKNLLANTQSILQYLQLNSEDSILATINFSYSYGNSLLLTHTKVGGTIVIENRISYPVKIIEQLYLSKVTGFSTVGSYINILLKQDTLEDTHLQNLKYITFAGESTNFEDIVKLNNMAPHIKIFIMYGQTEATARLSYLEPSRLFEKAGSIGRGIPGVNLRVVTEEGIDVKPEEIGEIIAKGDNIMKGYWNNSEDTEAVIKEGWLYTGDLATVDEEGYIYVKGRKDDIIKYLGHRISPVEIEAAINSYEQVLECAVIAIECEKTNGHKNADQKANEHEKANGHESVKQLIAYVVLKNDTLDRDKLIEHIRILLPPFKRPHIIEFIDELPRTNNGKIKRSDLRKLNNGQINFAR